MNLFHLENHLKNATSLADIYGVYWSARDMDAFFIGNHHFYTFIYESEAQAKRISKIFGPKWNIGYHSDKNDRGLTFYYSTMGVNRDANKKIRIGFNPSSDLQAIHEIAKESNTSWDAADYDYEAHRIPLDFASPSYSSHEELMIAVLENIFKFQKIYQQGITINYSLMDHNCACVVNTILKHCGYNQADREDIGEFSGTDWGEEDEISDSFFDLTYDGNTYTKEIHVPQCTWAGKIEEARRIQFDLVNKALEQGYNGCAYCMEEIDTDIKPETPLDTYTLHLLSLKCIETEDYTGADEAYIKNDGAIIWGPESINDGETRNLSESQVISFNTSTRVDLYDQDTGILDDRDDHLGGIDIHSTLADQGNQESTLSGDGAKYLLRYRVEKES